MAVQAVGDSDAALLIRIGITQPFRVYLLHHPTGRIIAVAGLRTTSVTVCRHSARILRVIFKDAHRCATAVIHRRQLSARRIVIARQRRSREIIRVFRVMCQPHFRQPDTVIRTVTCGRQAFREREGFCATGGSLFPVLLCPLRLRGQHQPETAACTVSGSSNTPGEFSGSIPVVCQGMPESISKPRQHPAGGQRCGERVINARDTFTPPQQPPRSLYAVRCQIHMRAGANGFRQGLPQ